MPKFVTIPTEIEAIQFTGNNVAEVLVFCTGSAYATETENTPAIIVITAHGEVAAHSGDWIIRGQDGNYSPFRNDLFEAAYRPATIGRNQSLGFANKELSLVRLATPAGKAVMINPYSIVAMKGDGDNTRIVLAGAEPTTVIGGIHAVLINITGQIL